MGRKRRGRRREDAAGVAIEEEEEEEAAARMRGFNVRETKRGAARVEAWVLEAKQRRRWLDTTRRGRRRGRWTKRRNEVKMVAMVR